MAKYDPLRDYLNTRPPGMKQVSLTFDEIGKMVGGLPRSAWKHKAWWGNDRKTHPQAKAWLEAGWQVHSFRAFRGHHTNCTETPHMAAIRAAFATTFASPTLWQPVEQGNGRGERRGVRGEGTPDGPFNHGTHGMNGAEREKTYMRENLSI